MAHKVAQASVAKTEITHSNFAIKPIQQYNILNSLSLSLSFPSFFYVKFIILA